MPLFPKRMVNGYCFYRQVTIYCTYKMRKNIQKTGINFTSSELIASCGINCRLCRAYVREKKPCPGCRGWNDNKSPSCINCRIKNCETLVKNNLKYCFACGEFPCARLAHLDWRYRTRYDVSVIDNLLDIKKIGIRKFVEKENIKWKCPECGAMICMHKHECLSCGYAWHLIPVLNN